MIYIMQYLIFLINKNPQLFDFCTYIYDVHFLIWQASTNKKFVKI